MGQIEQILTTIVIVGLILIGTGAFYTNLASNYGVNVTENVASFNRTTEVMEEMSDVSEQLGASNQQEESSILDLPLLVLSGGYQVLMLFLTLPSIVGNMITDLGTAIGVPGWAISGIILIVVISIIFSIVNAIMKRDV